MPEAAAKTKTEDRGPAETTTSAALKKRAVHKGVTLPSGAIVDIRLPNLAALLRADGIPNDLIEPALALQQDEDKKLTREDIEKSWDFVEWVIPKTLVKPEIKQEDVKDLDPMDIEMLAAFATRRTDMDAVGHQLGGLDTQASFREHRGIISLDSLVGDSS